MARLFVALMNIDPTRFSGVSAGGFDTFREAVQQGDAAIEHVRAGANATKLLVAPEYYFSQMSDVFANVGVARPMRRSEKHNIYADLKQLSSEFSDMILVAGSIFYRKKALLSNLKGYNVCPVLLNGHFLYKYYKYQDDGNIGQFQAGATHAHKDTNPYFRHNGIRFGIEICKDHSDNVLSNWITARGKPRVDVHIYISGTNTHRLNSIQAKVGGYLLHCDLSGTNRTKNTVVRVDATGFAPGVTHPLGTVAPSYTTAALGDGSTISVYDLTL